MRLPDFGSEVGFARLREMMGATEIVHLGDQKWHDWGGFGIDVGDISEVDVNPDQTLSYKGRRVLVYIRDQGVRSQDDGLRDFRYHVAECSTLTRMREENRFGRYVATTRTDGRFVVNLFRQGESAPFKEGLVREMGVCKNCLTTLDWRSYSRLVGAKKASCWRNFDPETFLSEHGSRVKGLPTKTPETAPLNQYPPDWSEISRRVRERSHWTCQKCELSFREPRTRNWLHVHHRDGNRANSALGNLQALCIGCHGEEFGHDRLKFSPGFREFVLWRRGQELQDRIATGEHPETTETHD
jgi:hypothetical protein